MPAFYNRTRSTAVPAFYFSLPRLLIVLRYLPIRMAKRTDTTAKKKPIEQYDHKAKTRVNNPPVGLVDAKSDAVEGKKTYAYDPHLDPTLVWAGKAERTSFEIPTVSLHVHERIDPRAIIEAVRKKNGSDYAQLSLFGSKTENPPLREAIEFYKHAHNWSNRFIAGDSLLVMNSLLEKEGMAGQVQMLYFDPPYGIKYGSNFQPFVNKRDVKDGKDEDLTAEPEMVKAFRDTWELGLHSYLSYLRDRLLLARELLHESGSVFVQISDENVHHVREVLDEVFGVKNYCALITYQKTGGFSADLLQRNFDYIIWYAKDKAKVKFHKLFQVHDPTGEDTQFFDSVELRDGTRRQLSSEEVKNANLIPAGARLYARNPLNSDGYVESLHYEFEFEGEKFRPPHNRHWTTTKAGMETLKAKKRLCIKGNTLRFIRYFDDYPASEVGINWTDTGTGGFVGDTKVYVVQTDSRALERCLLMTTDPGDLVLDITCGSGTTAFVAEQWGRRWMTCDTSRVALTLAKQRLMTSVFEYFQLAHPDEGVDSGLRYKTVPHVTLKSIANNEPPEPETLYDQPLTDTGKTRVTGPFTVEAVPAPMVKSPGEVAGEDSFGGRADLPVGQDARQRVPTMTADASVARSGATIRQDESLPFARGKNGRVAVKIVDDRGIESLKILEIQ
jgi:adenine-specific DNA-methyltransferase